MWPQDIRQILEILPFYIFSVVEHKTCVLSRFIHVWLLAILCTVVHQALLSMGFSRQEYWSGLPCPPPGDLSDPGMEPTSFMSLALAGEFFTSSATWEHKTGFSNLTLQITWGLWLKIIVPRPALKVPDWKVRREARNSC